MGVMIWYDAAYKVPVAPGAQQDGGFPSIEGHYCPICEDRCEVRFKKQIGVCVVCNTLILIQG